MHEEPGFATCRRATLEDAPEIARLVNEAFAEYRPWLVPPSGALAETAETIAAELSGIYGAFLAEIAGEPAGCVLFRSEGDDLYFGRLSVPPSRRGQGIATVLVDAVEREAIEQGRPGVVLSVRIALPANQRLFARLGYAQIARHAHPGFDQPTWIEMRKALVLGNPA